MRRRGITAGCLTALSAPVLAQPVAAPVAGMAQMLIGLIAVIALVFALAWLARRLGVPMQNTSPLMKRIATLSVGPRERLLLVEVGEQWLVLGVTSQSIRTLHQLPRGELPSGAAQGLGEGFAALLQRARRNHA